MAYCTGCKGTVHLTAKICPHCGGNFKSFFGPTAMWGEYVSPEERERREEEERQLKERREEERRLLKEKSQVEWERGSSSQNINPDQWSMEEIRAFWTKPFKVIAKPFKVIAAKQWSIEGIRSFWMKLFKVVMYSCLLIVCLIVGFYTLALIVAVAQVISEY